MENKNTKIIIGACIGIGLLIIISGVTIKYFFFDKFIDRAEKVNEVAEKVTDKGIDLMDTITDQAEKQMEEAESKIENNTEEAKKEQEQFQNELKVRAFNMQLESYNGTQTKNGVSILLDNVVTKNKTEADHIITVIFNQINTSVPDEITAIKQSLEDNRNYEVSLEYDTNGFVNQVKIS